MSTTTVFSRLASIGAALLLTLCAGQASPLIFAQPTNANGFVGDATATFGVRATGDATLAYQWQMQPGSSGGFSDISGATHPSLSVSSPTLAMNGYKYRCVLTCTGASTGTLTSAATTLNVYAVPTLTPSVSLSSTSIAANSTSDITIHITGLNAGDSVRIQRVLDADGNGSADLGEPLVQSVQVTDGSVSSIGGVTNTSVPHDEDGAADGSITTHFSLPSSAEMGRTAGSYLIRVSSPSGGFRPLQRTLTVTQPGYGQSISGQVLAGGSPLPYAGVVLISNSSNGNYVASAVADAAGNYTINAPVGDYLVLANQLGYVCQMGVLSANLAAAQTLTGCNPVLIAATCTVSGQVQDASGSPGLKGVQLMFGSNSNYFTLATSDSNGNYVVSAMPDGWKCEPSDYSLAALGYIKPSGKTSVTTTSGNVTSQNLRYSAATALLSGIVRNGAAAVMPGVVLDASQPSGNGFRIATDANGNFTFGVSAGTWYIQLDSGYAESSNLIGPSLQENVAGSQGISGIAIQLVTGTGTISGYVHDAGGNPVSTGVNANASINGNNYSGYADTDGSGNYSFPAINGQWSVNVSQSGYSQQTVQVNGSAVVNFTPTPVVAHLQGAVTNNGAAVSGASIGASLQGSGNTWIATTTDGSGNFDIGVTSNGTWNLQLESNYADSNSLVGPSLEEIVSNSQNISGIVVHVLTGTGTISGYVHNAGGTAVATGVAANATINDTNYFGYANTDGSGNYSLPVINGQWTVNVSQSGYTQQSVQVSGSAVVNFSPSSPFQQWQQTYFSIPQLGDQGISGIAAPVLSKAGYTNEIAYALGLNPTTAKASDLPTSATLPVAGISYLSLAFNRNLAATDLTYQVQYSTDLAHWLPLSTFSAGAWSPSNIVNETTTGNPNLKHVQVSDSQPLSSAVKRFLRLVVQQ